MKEGREEGRIQITGKERWRNIRSKGRENKGGDKSRWWRIFALAGEMLEIVMAKQTGERREGGGRVKMRSKKRKGRDGR